MPPAFATASLAVGGFVTLTVFARGFPTKGFNDTRELTSDTLGLGDGGVDAPGIGAVAMGATTGAKPDVLGLASGDMRDTSDTRGIGDTEPPADRAFLGGPGFEEFESPRRSVPNIPSRSLCRPIASRALTSAS